jgi:hypothetical protein
VEMIGPKKHLLILRGLEKICKTAP